MDLLICIEEKQRIYSLACADLCPTTKDVALDLDGASDYCASGILITMLQ